MAWSSEEKKRFVQLITYVAENYGKNYSSVTIKMLIEQLQCYPYPEVERAFQEHVATSPYPPKVSDIIGRIRGFSDWRDVEDIAERAYREALDAASRIGIYQSVRFKDPIINAVIRSLGGWDKICNLELGGAEEGRFRNEFLSLYRSYLRDGRVPRVDYLPGLVENENDGEHALPPVVEVGEARNRNVALYDAEISVYLQESRKMIPAPKPKQHKALPQPKAEQQKDLTEEEREEIMAALNELLKKIAKPMPQVTAEEVEREAARVN